MKIVTHNGKFHADDVFAVATLKLLLKDEDVEIVRTRDKDVIASCDYAVDVGGEYDAGNRRFDHHQFSQKDSKHNCHANSIPYASFGLVWKEYGDQICKNIGISAYREVALEIENMPVLYIDAVDNGVSVFSNLIDGVFPYTIGDAFDALMPTWREERSGTDDAFSKAVELATHILEREIIHAAHGLEAVKYVRDAYKASRDKRIIVLSEPYPYQVALCAFREPIFVVRPDRQSNTWHASAIRISKSSFSSRELFPEEWAGLRGSDLQDVTGVPDAIFCHSKRFLSVANSKEGAVQLAREAAGDNRA